MAGIWRQREVAIRAFDVQLMPLKARKKAREMEGLTQYLVEAEKWCNSKLWVASNRAASWQKFLFRPTVNAS